VTSDKKPADDFDGPWKRALERFLEPALRLLSPELHADIDWTREIAFLNKELAQYLPEGGSGKGHVDVFAGVYLKSGKPSRILLHAEVQADPETNFGRRIFRYWYHLFDARLLPVVSLVILADTRRRWRPDHFELATYYTRVRFDFQPVKLVDLEDRIDELEQSGNPFALFVVAHLAAKRTKEGEERLYWKLRLVRQLFALGLSTEDVRLLFTVVDWVLRLPADLKTRFRDEVHAMKQENEVEFINCIEEAALEKGIEKGMEKGRLESKRESVLQVLEARFGAVPEEVQSALSAIEDLKRLETLTRTAATMPDMDTFAQALAAD
jgi:hypothetical protein